MSNVDVPRLLLLSHRILAEGYIDEIVERGFEDARPGHLSVVMTIDRRSGTRLTDLARRARITKQGMMLLVDELEQRGYVRRVPDPEDGRAKLVRLTAKGRRYVGEARKVVAGIESRVRRDLGARDYECLRSSLEYLTGFDGDAG